MSHAQLHIFGIRHHGPGSARRLEEALLELEPELLCIESPKHAQDLIDSMDPGQLSPPVAVLSYPPKHPDKGSFLPLASFSPEYIAWQYAHARGIPMRCIDLPFQISRAEEQHQLPLFTEQQAVDRNEPDPFDQLAELAGFSETETWWDNFLEREQMPAGQVFPLISSLMHSMRPDPLENKSRLEEKREAHMRLELREACKEAGKVAVVCGAWHVPALEQTFDCTIKEDRERLKGSRKQKVQSVFIPWTYERLTRWSGYGAGISSPSWYEYLYKQGDDALVNWLADAAQFLRSEGYDCSPASVVEAVRFARMLAGMRDFKRAGLKELEDATLTVLCEGKQSRFDSVYAALIVGDAVGDVPEQETEVPLRKDFNQRAKQAGLSRYIGKRESKERTLDLRKEKHLFASHLLHQCALLGIEWGRRLEAPERALGSFHERWQLDWDPAIELNIISAGTYGSTLPQAASNRILEEYRSGKIALKVLASILHRSLQADLNRIIPFLGRKLQSAVAADQDVLEILAGLSELIYARRYSSVRGFDTDMLDEVIDYATPRLATGLADALRGTDEEEARDTGRQITALGHALPLLGKESLAGEWLLALERILETRQIPAYLRGVAAHLLFQEERLSPQDLARTLAFIFARKEHPEESARWLEGFLRENATLLRMHPQLFRIIDRWIKQMPQEQFTDVLPLLRRTFSFLNGRERELLMERIKTGHQTEATKGKEEAKTGSGSSIPEEYLELIDQILK